MGIAAGIKALEYNGVQLIQMDESQHLADGKALRSNYYKLAGSWHAPALRRLPKDEQFVKVLETTVLMTKQRWMAQFGATGWEADTRKTIRWRHQLARMVAPSRYLLATMT